jgi:hypothetical protein
MYQSCFSCWLTPQPAVCSLSLSLSSPELTASALPRTLVRRCLLSLEPCTGSVGSLSNPELVVSTLSQTLDWQCRLSLET